MLKIEKTTLLRWLIALVVLVFVGALISKYVRMPFRDIRPLEALPSGSAFFLQVHHPAVAASQMEKTYFNDSLQQLYPVRKWREDYAIMDKVFSNYQKRDLLHKNTLYAALEKNGSSDVDFVYVLDTRSRKFKLEDFLQKFNRNLRFRQHSFQGCTIYQVRLDADHFYYLSQYRNLLLMGRHSFLIEDAISQIRSVHSNIRRDPAFRGLDTLSSEPGSMHFYIQVKRLPAAISSFLKPESYHTFDWLQNAASWLALTCRFHSNSIQTTGYIIPARSQSFLNAIKRQSSGSSDSVVQIIPDNTALLIRWQVSDLQQFLYQIRRSKNKTFTEYFKPWLGKEIAYVMTEPLSVSSNGESFAVAGIRDLEAGKKLLQKFAEKSGKIKEKDYQSFVIYELEEPGFLQPLLGESFAFPDRLYFTLFQQHWVACGSQAALELWIDKYMAGQVMSNDPEFQSWSTGQYSYEHVLLYFKTVRLEQAIRALVRPELNAAFQREYILLSQMLHAGAQVHLNRQRLEVKGAMHFVSEKVEKTNILWKTLLNADAVSGPQVIRHPGNSEYFIFIQDKLHQIYLINSSGQILFKRQLDEPVLSDIFPVDIDRNGAYAFLFNTRHFIYVLDQNGQDQHQYPFRLQSPATTGLTAISFDQKSYEHYFLPSENGNLYGFDIRNNPLPGWNPLQGVGRVRLPLLHFQQGGRDYIVAINDAGKLFAFKRDGSARFPPLVLSPRIQAPLFVQPYEPYPRMAMADSTGVIHIVNLTGQSFRLGAANRKGKNAFAFADITGDKRKDYLMLKGNTLSGNYYQGEAIRPLFTYTFKQPMDDLFAVRPDTLSKAMIGTLDKTNKRIFLIDGQGKLYPDFPMSGTTPFQLIDLYQDRRKILIVAYDNSLYAYQLR